MTKSDSEQSCSLDREPLDTASDSVSLRTMQSASDLSSERYCISEPTLEHILDHMVSDHSSDFTISDHTISDHVLDHAASDRKLSPTSDRSTSDPPLDPLRPCSSEHALQCATLASEWPRLLDRSPNSAVLDHISDHTKSDRMSNCVVSDRTSDRPTSDHPSDPIQPCTIEYVLPHTASSDHSLEHVNTEHVVSDPRSESSRKLLSVQVKSKRAHAK